MRAARFGLIRSTGELQPERSNALTIRHNRDTARPPLGIRSDRSIWNYRNLARLANYDRAVNLDRAKFRLYLATAVHNGKCSPQNV